MFTTSNGIRMYVPSAQDAHQDEWYYLFRDEEHGEEFFVRAHSYEEAVTIAEDNFDCVKYGGKFSEESASFYDYDVY